MSSPDRAPIEVEVVEHVLCPQCQMVGGRTHQSFCGRTGDHTATLAPGSLDEALHRLGLMREARDVAGRAWNNAGPRKILDGPLARAWGAAFVGERAALAEVRRLREAANV